MNLTFTRDTDTFQVANRLPILPLRDVVVFPYMVIPLLVGRPNSISGLEEAMDADRHILLLAQTDGDINDPTFKDLYRIGTLARILQMVKLPDGTVKVLVEGLVRIKIDRFLPRKKFLQAAFHILSLEDDDNIELAALARRVAGLFEGYIKINKRLPDQIISATHNVENKVRLAYLIASHLLSQMSNKQMILESPTLPDCFQILSDLLVSELEILKLEQKIEDAVKNQVLENQKEFYLHEQLKAIHKELGNSDEILDEIEEIKRSIKRLGLPKEASKKAQKELSKLGKMAPMSPEATVIRNYLDWVISLPWNKNTKDNLSISKVSQILDEDHYGLEKMKERTKEFIAVLSLVRKMKGPILCFIGPPGVGKTSLARSIARALNRKFVRISLGGIHDEAEIRGHRRTYIGALPGRIIQAMKKAGSSNPVMLLDEIDKLFSDFRGDPASALLEVLDPEQNHAFSDHYLEIDYDLSNVLFIATGNVLHTVPGPLRDRMEIIRMPSYLESEKREIAKRFLVPKQLNAHGLKNAQVVFSDEIITGIIHRYTRESGVRQLEREIATVCRKLAKGIAEKSQTRKPRSANKSTGKPKNKQQVITISLNDLKTYLGTPKYLDLQIETDDQIGVATGLAWTEVGGDILLIEVSTVPGKGKLILTGKLGDVMKESAEAALSYIRSRSLLLGIDKDFYKKIDLHVHIPEGAVPKDGPSAGIAIATAMVSALREIPIHKEVALTGEVTLRGRVLPIGGLNEKLLAALRAGIKAVVIPKKNEKDLDDLPQEVKDNLEISLVGSMDDVLALALTSSGKLLGIEQKVLSQKQESTPTYAH